MKKLILKNRTYKTLLLSFKDWLDILGHAEKSVYTMPILLREFFHWSEQAGYNEIGHIGPKEVKAYYHYLKERPNEYRGGALGNCHLNKHQGALRKFREYQIAHNARHPLRIHLKYEENDTEERRNILTQKEIKQLFETTYHNSHSWERIRLRDRALLTCLYSCGLRRNETIQLDVGDILFDKRRIHVRKGKNYKERLVPFNDHGLRALEDYIYEARPCFCNSYGNGLPGEALFISDQRGRICGATVLTIVKRIAIATGNKAIIEKEISPHTLRHSIATHLLQRGVTMENIKTFLGHGSLESTQIYTHLLKTMDDDGL